MANPDESTPVPVERPDVRPAEPGPHGEKVTRVGAQPIEEEPPTK